MPLKPCRLPGCPNLTDDGDYCRVHRRYRKQPSVRAAFDRLTAKKDPLTIAFYNSRPWRNTSKRYRILFPLCEECEKNGVIAPAQLVHHKKKLQDILNDKENPLDFKFLESLCKNCHLNELREYKKNT